MDTLTPINAAAPLSLLDVVIRLAADPNIQNLLLLGISSVIAALVGKKANKARKKKARAEALAHGDLPLLSKEE